MLIWARQAGRGQAAHIIWLGFAQPNHGVFDEDDEYNTVCERVIEVKEKVLDRNVKHGMKTCQKCLTLLGSLIEQTMPED